MKKKGENSFRNEREQRSNQRFAEILDLLSRPGWKLPLDYCLRELVSNAQKALVKRTYFEFHHVQDDDLQSCAEATTQFLADWVRDPKTWHKHQKEMGKSIQ